MEKSAVIEAILAALAAELENYARSAKAAHAEATDEQSKAENKYDTRGLEASYLARGQSQQAAQVIEAVQQYQALEPRAWAAKEPVDLGALVEVELAGERTWYFLGPRAGGTEVTVGRATVVVITPTSPLAEKLTGRREGEAVEWPVRGRKEKLRVLAVR